MTAPFLQNHKKIMRDDSRSTRNRRPGYEQTHSFWIIYWPPHSFKTTISPLFSQSRITIYPAHEGLDEDTFPWTRISTTHLDHVPLPHHSQSFLHTLYRHGSSSSTNLRRKSTTIILLAQTFRSPLVGLASRSLYGWYYRSRCLHLAPGLALQQVTNHTIASSRKLVATPAFGL